MKQETTIYTKENYIKLVTKGLNPEGKMFKSLVSRINSLNEHKVKHEMNLLFGKDLERFLKLI